MTLLANGKPIDPAARYVVSGWASVNEGTEGPPVWDVVASYIERKKIVDIKQNTAIRVVQ